MREFLSYSRKNKVVGFCLIVVVLFLLVALFAPYLTPRDPFAMSLRDRLVPPGRNYPLGTDELGRDVFSRIILGTRISLFISVAAVLLAYVVGSIAGITAAWRGGLIDNLIMRAIDVWLSFPYLLMAIIIISIFGTGALNLILAIALWIMPNFTRIVRGCVLTIKETDYVEAARAIGGDTLHIIVRHVLPNYSALVIVYATLYVSRAIILEAALSFLGLGLQPPTPSWGLMISVGRTYIRVAPHIVLIPGIVITLAVLAFNIVGDGLRDALDPRLRGAEGGRA